MDIATVLRDAHFGRLQWLGEERQPYDSIYLATERLFDLLAERDVEFVLVGGLAMLQYVDGRNTSDIDLIVAMRDMERVPELQVASQDRDFARAEFEGVQVDLLLTSNALFEHVRKQHVTERRFGGRDLPCATVEGLLLLKLFALPSLYRQGDFGRSNLYEADIAALIREYKPRVEPLLAELAQHVVPTDVVAIREVFSDIAQRIVRFESSRKDGSPGGAGK